MGLVKLFNLSVLHFPLLRCRGIISTHLTELFRIIQTNHLVTESGTLKCLDDFMIINAPSISRILPCKGQTNLYLAQESKVYRALNHSGLATKEICMVS